MDIIKEIYNNNKIIIDPHTAVGLGVAKKLNIKKNCVVLSTAHPCKFPTAVTKAINIKSELPVELHYILNEQENFDVIKNKASFSVERTFLVFLFQDHFVFLPHQLDRIA